MYELVNFDDLMIQDTQDIWDERSGYLNNNL